MTTTSLDKIYTIEEYEALPEEEGRRYELVEGRLVDKWGAVDLAGTNEKHSRISFKLSAYLGSYIVQNQLGEGYDSGARFVTVAGDPATIRHPDLSFVQASRVVKDVVNIPLAPDLAVEVISPGNTFSEIETKIGEYFRAGSQLVWVIETDREVAHIYRAGSNMRQTISAEEELDGESVIPGFKLKLGKLFE